MLILFRKSQLALFDAPVQVAAHVRKDGVVVAPHTRIQKVGVKPMHQHQLFSEIDAPAVKPIKIKPVDTTMDLFAPENMAPAAAPIQSQAEKLQAVLERFGGAEGVRHMLLTAPMREASRMLGLISDLSGRPLAEVMDEYGSAPAAPVLPRKLTKEEAGRALGDAWWGGKNKGQKRVDHDYAGNDDGSGYVEAGIPLDKIRPNEAGELYDGTADPERVKEYAGKRIDAPVHLLHGERQARLGSRHANIMDGGHRVSAARLRGDTHIRAIMQQSHYDRLMAQPAQAVMAGDDLHDNSVIRDGKGAHYRVHYMRGDLVVAHPIVDGKAQVSADTTVRFRIGDNKDPDSSERPGPIYLVSSPAADVSKPEQKIDTSVEPVDPVNVSFGVPAGITKGARREINQRAAGLVNSGADLTDADRATLRQYSGNGGCGDSLNEFYTDPEVATAMWAVLGKLGVTEGTVLEPSCATGVFMHTAPAGIKLTGVEMDPTSAAIAEALHGEHHEIITSSLERFATTDGARQFDAVIGNAPFGIRGSLIKDDKSFLKTAEGYFLDTSLDKSKPGGVVAMIVPTGVMDSKSARTVRQRLLCKGEFLGAVRMPNTAFEHSHTEVTTDIVFFRKRPDDVAGALLALDKPRLKALGVWDDEYLSGGYFDGRGAPSVFGTMEAGWRAKAGMGDDITVSGSMVGVADSVAAWHPDEHKTATPTVQDVLAAIGDDEALRKKALGAALKRPYDGGKAGDTKTEDGVQYILQGKPLRWHRVDEFTQSAAVTDAQDLARDIESAINGGSREGLAARVHAYVSAHGAPAKNANLLIAASQDRVLYRLIGAVQPDGTLSDVVADRASRRIEGSLDTAAQSLALEAESGMFTVEQLADRMDKPADEVEDTLFASSAYAYAGDGKWTPMDRYLTGELWPKLDALRAAMGHGELRDGMAPKYELQAAKLEEAIDPKSLEDVEILLNSAFLPTAVIEAFYNEQKASGNEWVRKQDDVSIKFADSWYTVTGGANLSLLQDYLNRDGVKKDDLPRIEKWNDEFKEWLLGSAYRDQVEDLYNRKFRGFVQAEYSDETIAIPGMDTEGLKQFQYSGLRWALAAGKGIVAADVGLGKTVRGLMLARMAKINGTAKRPTFVVPKSVLANWVAEAEKWFPGSRILVVGETYSRDKAGALKSKTDTADVRNQKLHDMRQNDYDFVFFSQPAFNDIDLDPIIKGQYVNSDFWVQRGDKKGNEGDKRLKKIRESYEQAIANREFQKRTDAIYWDDLGIDMMIVDEAHGYKNLYAAKQRFGESPKFLGGQGQSNRAFDMQMKTRYLREHNDGNGVFLLTATPTKNSPLEIYSMLSHVAPEAFERIGIRNSEEFLDRFCTFVEDKVLSTTGNIEDAIVTAGFKNLGELREVMRRYIDRKTAADVGLAMPARDDQMHLIDMSERQEEVYAGLRQELIDSAKDKDASGDSHVFSIMSRMGKAALDLELLDPDTYAGEVSPKYTAMAKHISDGVLDGGQVVFSEAVDSHEKIAAALVAAGIPRDQIAIMNATTAASSAKRQNISDGFNAGKFKVVIGNKIMEEGVNLQKGTTDIHHADLPWDPATMQQRNGRGLRQGNLNASVRIHTYLSKGSFDGYRYQSMMAKKDWQDMLWNGGDTVDNLGRAGKFDRADLMIMMSADPEGERAKYELDKAAATERHDTEKRREVAVEFQRVQKMKQSYGALKNKDTASAVRLRQQLDKATTMLRGNKYFAAKGALDHPGAVVIHPDTGAALMANVGLDIAENDGTSGKWVVTGVNPTTSDVTMRRYGEPGRAGMAITVPIAKLSGGVKPFEFDAAAEAAHVHAKLEEAAAANLNSLTDWKDIQAMPSSVLEANHDLIQRQIKEGAKAYKFRMPGGDVPMVRKDTGELTMATSYGHTMLHNTHDYLLPTDGAKEKAIQAWLDERRNATLGTEYVSRSSGRGSRSGGSDRLARRSYKGASYSNKNVNPLKSLLKDLSGSTAYGVDSSLERRAKAQLHSEQLHAIRHAASANEAVHGLMPLAKVAGTRASSDGMGGHANDGNNSASYPKDALAVAWARSRQLGQLGEKVQRLNGHSDYAYAGGAESTVHTALVRMARASGHHDLAHAMGESVTRHKIAVPPAETYNAEINSVWAGHPHAAARFQRALAAAEAGGFADEQKTTGWTPGYDADRNKTKRQFLTEKIAESIAHTKHKEAA